MTTRTLTKGQIGVLATAAVVMVAVGVAGAIGTFSNALAEFGREATAAGVVAAGEGLTLILALTMLGLTLLGQSSPVWVRVGLWLAPSPPAAPACPSQTPSPKPSSTAPCRSA